MGFSGGTILTSRRFINMNTKKSNARKFIEKKRRVRLSFGEMLTSLRECDEMTQVEMAKKLGISRAHLCDIEKGRRQVTAERAADFAQKLGYSVNQFVALALEDHLHKLGLKLKIEVVAA
ncbi:MAG: XRE family transcriptional regulator [Deltaproteobacteria bacterium CG_4_10_14_0_2_um_filter_43_8]|nr:MAG: XRE family transcriptional regulator [Deltaproteobacteria bacterium CG_4_10_14_0_2_um_filter_43_8]